MNRLHLAVGILSLALAQAAAAQPTREALLAALHGYEIPLTRERLLGLGSGWEQTAEALARDTSVAPLYRARALAALGFSKSPSTPALLRAVLVQKGAAVAGPDAIEAKEALLALAAVEGDLAIEDLGRYLDHPVPDTRAAAARALGHSRAARARSLLERRAAQESELSVKLHIEAALKATVR